MISAPAIGLDSVMFVQDKEFVYLEYVHSTSQNSTSRDRMIQQIGRVVLANIRARHESGENEADEDDKEDSKDEKGGDK
jgi:hypothetical protein